MKNSAEFKVLSAEWTVAWVLQGVAYLAIVALLLGLLTSCSLVEPRTIIQTVTVDKPVPVPCRIPPIERPAMAVDHVSPADDMVTLNRALRAELEQRRGYELRLEAGVKACQ